MKCSTVQRTIQAYVDGAATLAERAVVDRHVEECARCARSLAETRALVSMLGALPQREVSGDFERRLAARLESVTPAAPPAAWWERFQVRYEWRLRMPALMTAGSLAVGLVAALVGPQVNNFHQGQSARAEIVASAVDRHRQLERANPDPSWDAVEDTIALSASAVVIE